MHLSQKHGSNFVPQRIKYVSCKVYAAASVLVDVAFKRTQSCIQVHYSAYSIKYPYSHCKREGRTLKVGLLTRIFWGILHLEVHPCLSDTSARKRLTGSFCVSPHQSHPAPAEPQSASPLCSQTISIPYCSLWTARSTSRHLWMSVDVTNQGATGQQQTSVTQCFTGALSLPQTWLSKTASRWLSRYRYEKQFVPSWFISKKAEWYFAICRLKRVVSR